MAFPTSPSNNQQATVNDIIYVYNSVKGAWLRLSSAGIATANLTVAAVITDNYYRADGTSLLGVNKSVYNGTATAGTSVTLIDSVPAAGNTSVTWTITSNDNSNSTFKHSIVGSLNDGANVYYTEYGIILSNANVSVSTFTSNIVSGNLRLYATGDSANVGITFQRTLLGSSTDVGYLTAGARGFDGVAGAVGNINATSGDIVTTSTTAATSTTSGALRVAGGAGIAGDLYAASFNGIDLAANLGATSGSLVTLTANAASQAGALATLTANAGVQAGAIVTANTAMKGYVDNQITVLVGGAPGALDTLNELATALGNNASYATTITNSLANITSNVTTLTSNAAVQAGDLATIYANLGSVSGTLTTLTANAGAQADSIATLTSTKANLSGANFTNDINVSGTVTALNILNPFLLAGM
jgi:hypothetical protein